jgi:putative nucleotidyltransferase with HDIG domain
MPGDPKPLRKPPQGSPPTPKRRWRPAWLRWDNAFVQLSLFTLFLLALAPLITLNRGLPGESLDPELVGTPAETDLKASRDYTYEEIDAEATRKKRDEAAAAVPSVYDYHTEHRELRLGQLRAGFGELRRALIEAEAAWRRERAAPNAPPLSPSDLAPAESKAPPPPAPRELRAFRLRAAEELRPSFDRALQEILADEDFMAMAADGFSSEAEDALAQMIDRAMAQRIVGSLRLLEAEGRGVTLRHVHYAEERQTFHVQDFGQSFWDREAAARELSLNEPEAMRAINDPPLRRALLSVAQQLIHPNTIYNPEETERRREAARAAQEELRVVLTFRKGQNIVDRGHIITQRHLDIARDMESGEGGEDRRLTLAQTLLGTLLVTLLLVAILYLFSRATIRKFRAAPRDRVLIGGLILAELALLQGLLLTLEALGRGWESATPAALLYGAPVALGAILVRLVHNSETAMVFSIALAILAGLTLDQSITWAAFVLVSSISGAQAVGVVCHRMDLAKAGLRVGAINALCAAAILLLEGQNLPASLLWGAGAGFVGGLLSGVLVNAVLPLIENLFRYTTDIKLLELADLNHPALKELILKAPGSYHHSVVVGTLAKEAAEAIHANPLLARVGAYYHDIGKGKNPQYFAENQRAGHNPHDKLKPNMSALIIKAHVKDGLELARQYELPQEIQDFIAMHHGTTLISYFYHRAKTAEAPGMPEVDPQDYRYPGPKPQTRETAIVMLADGIEAASRALPDPSPARLKGLVQTMINKLFADGQLDECELTLKDLNAIARAFIQVLTSMYHARPQYPGQEKNPGARAARKPLTGEFKRKDLSSTGERRRKREDDEDANHDGEDLPHDDTETTSIERPRLPGALMTTGDFSRALTPPEMPARGPRDYVRMTGTMIAVGPSANAEPRPDDDDEDDEDLSVDADSASILAISRGAAPLPDEPADPDDDANNPEPPRPEAPQAPAPDAATPDDDHTPNDAPDAAPPEDDDASGDDPGRDDRGLPLGATPEYPAPGAADSAPLRRLGLS